MRPVDLFDEAVPVACPCGDLMQVRWIANAGANGGDVAAGGDYGRAGIDRECPTCGLSMTVEVSRG